jgi:class 3 adenylate cyclase/plastocyanin
MASADKVGNKAIIIPRGTKRYFEPRFVTLLPRQTVTWINRDTVPHSLTSGEPDNLVTGSVFKTGPISTGRLATVTVGPNIGNIPYFCSLHPSERGTIVVMSKQEESLTNSERLELLDSVFTLNNPSEVHAIRSALERHFDPNTLIRIADPDLLKVHNKILTIVFWDLSGFSVVCESLKAHPVLVVEFLKEYYTQATNIIHKYDGVLDKFIGDGIMAFFGFHSRDGDENKHAIDAVNAAIELKDSFEKTKKEWVDIWRKKISDETISIGIKCGINTGYALVGYMPTKERDDFTAIGTHVNLASRLEGKATGNQIIISSHTKDKIQDHFTTRTILVKPHEEIKAFEDIREYYEIVSQLT